MSIDDAASVSLPSSQTGARRRLELFEAYGIELEYMIVDAESLNVCPVTDQLIAAECGRIESEIDLGTISWSNELALHVVELKTSAPAAELTSLTAEFQQHVHRINARLATLHPAARLMPSAMHPWMNPDREMHLWPHEYSAVYEAYDRIFDCRGHGWANLQSVHLNLPFAGDEQFGRLHAAIRLLLPLLPGIAASSPIMNGTSTGLLDNRLQVYQGNAARVPSVAGRVIPECVYTEESYRQEIFQRMYQDIAPLDPDNVLQDEFLNSRGAIARFDRGSIEIRVIDVQECPAADLAVLQCTVAVLKALCDQRWCSTTAQQKIGVEPLFDILTSTIRDADQAVIADRDYLSLFGLQSSSATVGQLWQYLVDQTSPQLDPACSTALHRILSDGPLARRLHMRLNHRSTDRGALRQTYSELCDCLQNGEMFVA